MRQAHITLLMKKAVLSLQAHQVPIQFALLVFIWSTSFLWIKVLVTEVPPAWMSVWRLALGAAVLSITALFMKRSERVFSPIAIPWRVIVVVASLGNALPYTLIHAGEVTVTSGIAAVLMGTMPLATFALAWLLLGERLLAIQTVGLLLGFFGLVFLIGVDALSSLNLTKGQFLITAGAICYALSATLVRKLGSSRSIANAAITLWLATALVTPFALLESPSPVFPQSTFTWVALMILGVFCTGIAALLYFQLLDQVPANKFAQINYIIPVLGYVWGLLFLGESVSWQAIVAAIMILVGVNLVLRKKTR